MTFSIRCHQAHSYWRLSIQHGMTRVIQRAWCNLEGNPLSFYVMAWVNLVSLLSTCTFSASFSFMFVDEPERARCPLRGIHIISLTGLLWCRCNLLCAAILSRACCSKQQLDQINWELRNTASSQFGKKEQKASSTEKHRHSELFTLASCLRICC